MPKSVQTVRAPAKPAAPAVANKVASEKTAPQRTAATTGKASSMAIADTDAAKPAPAKSNTTDAMAAKQPDVAAVVPETAGSATVNAPMNAPINATDDAQANTTVGEGKTTAMAHAGDVSGATADAAAPRCDVQACAQRYHSFSVSDCTYQPFDGPRRLCTVGNPPKQADAAPAGVQTSDASKPAASSSCHYDACGEAYRSFDPATCTWQPFEGPRRLCEK